MRARAPCTCKLSVLTMHITYPCSTDFLIMYGAESAVLPFGFDALAMPRASWYSARNMALDFALAFASFSASTTAVFIYRYYQVLISIREGFHTKIPHFFEIWPNIPIYLMFAVQISIPYQYTSFWGSGIPIYLMFSENSSNIPIYRMHDLGAQKGHTNIPHVFEKWPNIPI